MLRRRFSRRSREDLAYALGYPPEAEPPEWIELVQQVRRDRTVRQEIELDAWGHVATALRALEKHWDQLNPDQQWSVREHLRSFARTESREWWFTKMRREVARDQEVTAQLRADGWHVLRMWESEVKANLSAAADRVAESIRQTASPKGELPA